MAFGTFDIAGSGLDLSRLWLDMIGHNIANLNTRTPGNAAPFRAAAPVAVEAPGARGVVVAGVAEVGGQPARVYDPTSPLADAEGLVTLPVVDLGAEMVNMIMATRSYQANIRTVEAARETYQAALTIGR